MLDTGADVDGLVSWRALTDAGASHLLRPWPDDTPKPRPVGSGGSFDVVGCFSAAPLVAGRRTQDDSVAVCELPPATLVVVADRLAPYGALLGQRWLARAAAVLDVGQRTVRFGDQLRVSWAEHVNADHTPSSTVISALVMSTLASDMPADALEVARAMLFEVADVHGAIDSDITVLYSRTAEALAADSRLLVQFCDATDRLAAPRKRSEQRAGRTRDTLAAIDVQAAARHADDALPKPTM
jgi:hypothetical protein